jgi:cytosine/adenosine deaminase-related metal-dependent hydrolase
MIDLLIEHGLVVTMDHARLVIENGALAILDARIVDVGDASELRQRHVGGGSSMPGARP